MILIQISLTVIVILYWLFMPALFTQTWTERKLEGEESPFKKVLKDTNWVVIFWWFLMGLLITGGVIELWKI